MRAAQTVPVHDMVVCGVRYAAPEHSMLEAGELAPYGPFIQYPQGHPRHNGRYAYWRVIRK